MPFQERSAKAALRRARTSIKDADMSSNGNQPLYLATQKTSVLSARILSVESLQSAKKDSTTRPKGPQHSPCPTHLMEKQEKVQID